MKETHYFRHDCNARQDEKILALRMKHGWEGYGIYWGLIERLRGCANYECVKDYNLIAFDLRVNAGIIKSIVEDFGLFTFIDDNKRFYSKRLSIDMNFMDELSASRSAAGKKGMNNRYQKSNTVITELQQSYNGDITIRKENNKEENNKRKDLSNDRFPKKVGDANSVTLSGDAVSLPALREFFNEKVSSSGSIIPKINSIIGKRADAVRARAREYGKESVRTVITKAVGSDFLNGKNQRGFKATFDWIFRPNNFPKVLEGNYDNDKQQNGYDKQNDNDKEHWRGGVYDAEGAFREVCERIDADFAAEKRREANQPIWDG